MKALDLKPTDKNIYDAFIDDKIGRREQVLNFVKMLNVIEDNCVVALEGNWGSGKTFFVKQVQMVINANNKYYEPANSSSIIAENKNEIIQKCARFQTKDGYTELKPQVCVYYDAWQNDNDEDPMISLVYSIIKETDSDFSFNCPNVIEIFSAIGDLFLKKDFSKLIEEVKGTNVLQKIREEKDGETIISNFLQSLLPEKGERLVVFVDELDRCNPSYAVKVLERIKHYFANERITFVFSVNTNELQHTIRKHYGDDFNATRYLDRFFDIRVELPQPDFERYLFSINFYHQGSIFNAMCTAVINKFHLEMRGAAKFIRLANMAVPKYLREVSEMYQSASDICVSYIVPIVIGLKLTDIQAFEKFVNGEDGSSMMEFREEFRRGFFANCVNEKNQALDAEKTGLSEQRLEEKMNEIYRAIFVERYDESREIKIGNVWFDKSAKNRVMSIVGLLHDSVNFDE